MTAYTIGGSEAAAALGLDPYLSAYALGCRKLGISAEPEQTEAMTNGLRLQEPHADWIAADGYELMPAPADGFTHSELPWLIGHPDYFVNLDGYRSPLELKARGLPPSAALRLRDSIQALIYAEILGAEEAMVSELCGGYGGFHREQWRVRRDVETFVLMTDGLERFLDLLSRGKLPAPDGSDSARDALRQRFADAERGEAKRAPRPVWEHVLKSRELGELIDTATRQKAREDQKVMDFMGTATELISPYDTLAATWRPSHRLDADALREAYPEIAAEFSEQRLNATALRKARPDLHSRYSAPSTRKFLVKP